jgi:hypothetical protein
MRQEWVGKRKSVRQSCLIRAEVRFLDDRPSLDCTVTEMGAGGARLEVDDPAALPDDFDLFIPARNELKHAHVTRREPNFAAVVFMASRSEDPNLIGDLIKRLAQVEQHGTPADPSDHQGDARLAALEDRILQLEAELAITRGVAEAAADRPAPPDRMVEVQALRDSLTALADRLERTAAASEPEPRIATLAEDIEELRRTVTELGAAMAGLGKPDPVTEAQPAPEELAEEVSALRQSVQSLILLVSQLVARSRAAA